MSDSIDATVKALVERYCPEKKSIQQIFDIYYKREFAAGYLGAQTGTLSDLSKMSLLRISDYLMGWGLWIKESANGNGGAFSTAIFAQGGLDSYLGLSPQQKARDYIMGYQFVEGKGFKGKGQDINVITKKEKPPEVDRLPRIHKYHPPRYKGVRE